jgi:hypothetical protein
MAAAEPAAERDTSSEDGVMAIGHGDRVLALNARGERNERIALTGIVRGRDFPVIWICRPEEWVTAQAEGCEPEGVPWPAEDVQPVSESAATSGERLLRNPPPGGIPPARMA